MTSEQFLDEFYDEYLRSPRMREFEACGGDLDYIRKKYGGFVNYLTACGYEPCNAKTDTYEVFDDRGRVIFAGIPREIGEEFGVVATTVTHAYRTNGLLVSKYKVKKKEFDASKFKIDPVITVSKSGTIYRITITDKQLKKIFKHLDMKGRKIFKDILEEIEND